jgi:cytochrome c oxidase subunit 3
MATTVFPPMTDTESSPSDNNTNGSGGGGPSSPNGSGRDTAERGPERSATLPGAYRLVAFIVMIWVTALFGALTIVLESRWAHSPNWVSIRLPQILYVDAAILVLSSLTIEVARRSLQRGRGRRCIRGILVSLWMGFAFLVGQTLAWQHGMSCLGEVCVSMRTRGAFSCIW